MSNDNNSGNHGTRFEGFVPGMIETVGDTQTRNVVFDMPNGSEAAVQIRTNLEEPEVRAKHREEFLQTVHPASLTEGLERDIARMTEQYNDHSGFDRAGNPVMRVQGREREILQMRLANRKSALVLAQRERALAEGMQARAKATKQVQEDRISAAAEVRAQELVESAEIERRAKLLAARAGGSS